MKYRTAQAGFALVFCVLMQPALVQPLISQPKSKKPLVQEGHLTAADNVRLFYRKVGEGSDFIVFLHGGPGLSMENDGFLMDPLADDRHTLIMYDQRGGGRSDIVTDPALLTASSHVRDLEALREHLGIPKMSLIGLSWGSALAVLYADAHPERIARIVFLNPMPPANKPYVQQREEKTASLIAGRDRERLQEIRKEWALAGDDHLRSLCVEQFHILSGPYFSNPRSYDPSRPEASVAGREIAGMCGAPAAALRNLPLSNEAAFRSLGDFDFRPMLSKLKVPVLVVEGEHTNIPLDATQEWVRAAPGARFLFVPGAGHWALPEKPEAVQEIGVFLAGKWPPAAKPAGAVVQ